MAQSAPRPKKVLTPDQVAYQGASARWMEQYNALRSRLRQAYAAETTRAKAPECPNASTTRSEEECLSQEIGLTQANYTAVTGTLRSILALAHPKMPGEPPTTGPTGTEPSTEERVAEFDRIEAASAAYRKLASTAAFNEFRGGTLAPVFAQEAELKLIRLHLDELAFLYDTEFSTR